MRINYGDLKERLKGLDQKAGLMTLQEILAQELSYVLQINNYQEIDVEQGFFEMGLDLFDGT